MWIRKDSIERQIYEARRVAIKETKDRLRAEEILHRAWISTDGVKWVETETGRAVELIRAEMKAKVDEERARADMRATRAETLAREQYLIDVDGFHKQEDAAYTKGYGDGFSAGQRSPRNKGGSR